MSDAVAVYDLGRSRCRAALVVDGERVSEATVSSEATVVDRAGAGAVAAVLRGLADRLDPAPVAGVALGLAGLGRASTAAAVLRDVLRDLHGDVPTVVASDVVIAHAGALGGRPGVVVLAGTGAVTLGVSAAGDGVQVDGWGYLLGDAGSGFAIGRDGLRAALSDRDGRGPRTGLTGLAEATFGPLGEVPARLLGGSNPARLVASFSDAVADAARAGDGTARDIWAQAASDLARSAAAAVERLRELDPAAVPVRVSWSGGLFANTDLLREPLRDGVERLAPPTQLTPPEGDPLDGAARLARDDQTCLERLLARRDGTLARPTNDNASGRVEAPRGREG